MDKIQNNTLFKVLFKQLHQSDIQNERIFNKKDFHDIVWEKACT